MSNEFGHKFIHWSRIVALIALCNVGCDRSTINPPPDMIASPQAHSATSAAPLPITREVAEDFDFIPIPSERVRREPRLTARLATFKISESDAYQIAARAAEFRTKEGQAPTVFVPIAVIGRYYFFAKPYKTKILLTGYYVNGDSGAVSWREGGEYKPKK